MHGPGEVLRDGRYVVVGSLGVGSQGETLDATDKRDGRLVAIKRFAVRGAKSWKDVELAEREAAVLSSLNHPGLPRYIEHFEENGALYLVMEKVEGESLAARRKRGQALSHEQVLRFLTDVAACLRYLHGHAPPIVHRDIKPGNVILRPDGSYCLVDFGSVRDRLKPEGGSTVVGTFGFMAPEQFQGRAAPCSDVYAVGATAICLLTGREPEDLPHKGLSIDVEALRGQVDRRLIVALRSMLEPDPDARAGSVDEALQVAGLLGGAPAASERQRVGRESRHERKAEERAARHERRAEERAARREWRARRHAGEWHRPGPPVPPGVVLGRLILLALRVASVATFALFSVLLPLLFTILADPRRRERMRAIERAGQRGLAQAREHIRYQFLGGPTPSSLAPFMRVTDAEPFTGSEEKPRSRVAIDAEAEELELEAEQLASEAEARRDASRRGR